MAGWHDEGGRAVRESLNESFHSSPQFGINLDVSTAQHSPEPFQENCPMTKEIDPHFDLGKEIREWELDELILLQSQWHSVGQVWSKFKFMELFISMKR
jgi:hypothetical protein